MRGKGKGCVLYSERLCVFFFSGKGKVLLERGTPGIIKHLREKWKIYLMKKNYGIFIFKKCIFFFF